MSASPFIIGTAGHIDHGKTALVERLTGVNTDTLPEEQERGITVSLGFAYSEIEGRRVAFVDCPGHAALVRTMIAGACALDAGLVCVSASEGVMPQTQEHLAILELLGLSQAVVALTQADLVDEELRELAMEEVREQLEEGPFAGAEIIATSAVTGEGIPELRAALARLPARERDREGDFRFWLDRAFQRAGFGVVVTGTVIQGELRSGEELELQPEGLRLRVRGIQVEGRDRDQVSAGQRAALNLSGLERDQLRRGQTLTRPGTVQPVSVLDVRYQHLADAPPLPPGSSVRLLCGTAEVMARAWPIGEGGLEAGGPEWVQLRTESPVVAARGDHVILRRASPLQTLGGGEVVDPWATRVRQRDWLDCQQWLDRMQRGDDLARLERAGLGGWDRATAQRRGIPRGAVELGSQWLAPRSVEQLEQVLLRELEQWHWEAPLSPGAGRRSLHRGALLALTQSAFDQLLLRLESQGRVVLEHSRIRLPGWEVQLSEIQARSAQELQDRLAEAGLQGLSREELLQGVAEGEDLLSLLLSQGRVVGIRGSCIARASLDALQDQVVQLIRAQGSMSTGDFKELTGLTRRGAIPLLEWLDAKGLTLFREGVRTLRSSPEESL